MDEDGNAISVEDSEKILELEKEGLVQQPVIYIPAAIVIVIGLGLFVYKKHK